MFSSVYVSALDNSGGVFAQLPPDAQHATRESVGAAALSGVAAARDHAGRALIFALIALIACWSTYSTYSAASQLKEQ